MAKKPTTAYGRYAQKMNSRARTWENIADGVSVAAGIASMLTSPSGVGLLGFGAVIAGSTAVSIGAAGVKREYKAKAYAAQRGAMKRAKLNAAPVTAQGKQQKAMRVASGWVKPHNATSAKGKTYFVKGHFRKSA